MGTLSRDEIERFVADGFVKIEGAFSRELARECVAQIDQVAGVRVDDPATWREPVIRLPGFSSEAFRDAANTPRLQSAWSQLVGDGQWAPLLGIGTFVLRFPVPGPVNDDGWHIDVSFAGPDSTAHDFRSWRANVFSRGRGLLMLYLFTDVGEADGPTRIRVGSHLAMARRLGPAGEAGLSLGELAKESFEDTSGLPEALAAGEAGTVYLCHPFLVHAAQRNTGKRARYMAQPPLVIAHSLSLERADGAYTPVERAVRLGLTPPSPA